MTRPRVIWSETLHCGGTTDGYSAEITRSDVGGIVLCIRAPVGNPLYQPCASINLAKAHVGRASGGAVDTDYDEQRYAQKIAIVKQDRHGRGNAEHNLSAIVTAVNTLPSALDEIERLDTDLAGQDIVIEQLSAELSRVKAERDEAVRLLSGLIVGKDELALDRLCKAEARSFLSRMEGK